MDILKHYGFVVGAQNQIINLNSFIMGATVPNDSANSDSVQSPTAPPANTIFQNQSQTNQSNPNHSMALTHTVAAHMNIHNTSASSTTPNTENNDGFRSGDTITITTRPDQILAISPTSQQSQSLNISNFNSNSNSMSIHTDHLDVDGSSSCSNFNRCNNNLSSANHMDNTRLSLSNCSNMQNCNANTNICTFSSFIDNTAHPNRNARPSNQNNSSSGRRVSDV